MVETTFSQRFAQALERAGFPDERGRQGRLAKIFDVSGETIRKWLNDEGLPELKRYPEFRNLLRVNGEWLFFGNGPMEIGEPAAPYTVAHVETAVPDDVRQLVSLYLELHPVDRKEFLKILTEKVNYIRLYKGT